MMSPSAPRARAVEVGIAVIGIALVACAVGARQTWLDRHFLPSFFLPRYWYVLIETAVRISLGAVGLLLAVVVRSRLACVIVKHPADVVRIVVAIVLALAAGEWVMRHVHLGPTEWLSSEEEPRRLPDERLGWVLMPARTGHASIGGRGIDYAIDPAGYRVRRVDDPVDPARPTLVFAGESVMFGEGLQWDETIPAQVGARLGMPVANLAIHGYSSDQAYLRLEQELPRFQHPIAVVSLFMTALFGRNLDEDRPHLGPGLVWLPAQTSTRLASLIHLIVPFRADRTVERGTGVTRAVLHATVGLARARGARPLIVVPQFGPEDRAEEALRRRVLDEGLPYVLVVVDTDWRLAWDRHPNARAAGVIADAIAARLRDAAFQATRP
jgi:hypothetical protein